MPDTSTPPEKGRRIRRRPDQAVVAEVRSAFASADANHKKRPGRGALTQLTGGTEYQVRRAIATLKTEQQPTKTPATKNVVTKTLATKTPPARNPAKDRGPGKLVLETESSPGPPPAHRQNGTPLATTATPAPPSTPEPNPESSTGPSPEVTPAGDPGSPARQPADASPHSPPRAWPLGLIGLAAAVAVWGGWVDLGRLTGFGMVQPLPGLVDGLRINTAIVLPIGIEAYGGYALRTWLSSAALSAKTRRYAGWSALASLVVGAGAQVASHLMKATGITIAPWGVTVVVSCVPVVVLGLATGLATLVRQDTTTGPLHAPTTAPRRRSDQDPHHAHRAPRLATALGR